MPTGFHYGNYNDDNWNTLNAPQRYGHITMCYNNGGTGDSARKFFVSIGEGAANTLHIRRVWGSFDTGWKTISLT